MSIRITSQLAALAFGSLMGAVHAQWHENGELAPETTWRKTWGQHGAMLQLIVEADELFDAWEEPEKGVPMMTTTDIAERGVPITGVILFSGCTPNGSGLCDAQASFLVFKPDGSAYSVEETTELWIGKRPPPEGKLQLAIGGIGVRIEPKDPSGTYTVRARLIDKVSNAEVELTRAFRVEDGPQK